MLREISLSEMVKKGISKEDCVFVARKRGSATKARPGHITGAYCFGSRRSASAPRSLLKVWWNQNSLHANC